MKNNVDKSFIFSIFVMITNKSCYYEKSFNIMFLCCMRFIV